jgi:hypothetical protein
MLSGCDGYAANTGRRFQNEFQSQPTAGNGGWGGYEVLDLLKQSDLNFSAHAG